jgi:hypothetical protein
LIVEGIPVTSSFELIRNASRETGTGGLRKRPTPN